MCPVEALLQKTLNLQLKQNICRFQLNITPDAIKRATTTNFKGIEKKRLIAKRLAGPTKHNVG